MPSVRPYSAVNYYYTGTKQHVTYSTVPYLDILYVPSVKSVGRGEARHAPLVYKKVGHIILE